MISTVSPYIYDLRPPVWPNISPSPRKFSSRKLAPQRRHLALMRVVPPSRVDRPPPGGVGQFQIPVIGVSGLILATMLLTQNPSAALAGPPHSNPAAACTEQPARTPPQPALTPPNSRLSDLADRAFEDVLELSESVIPVGIFLVLANSKADTIKAELLADLQDGIVARYTGKLPKLPDAQLHLLSRAATEKLHQLTVEGRWNEDKTMRVTAFFLKGKIKHAPSSILDPRSGIVFDLRYGFGPAEPLVLCVVMGTTILDKRDVSDLVLDGVQIVGGAEVCLRLPAITPRPVPPLLRECRICHHICRLSATCFLA